MYGRAIAPRVGVFSTFAVVSSIGVLGLPALDLRSEDVGTWTAALPAPQLPAANSVVRCRDHPEIVGFQYFVDLIGNRVAIADVLEIGRVEIHSHMNSRAKQSSKTPASPLP